MKHYLKDRFGSVALHIVSVDDNLNDAIPHLLADVVPSNANEVEDGVYIPGVVHGIFLCQYGHFQHLNETAQSKLVHLFKADRADQDSPLTCFL